jgi:hypothetical protein
VRVEKALTRHKPPTKLAWLLRASLGTAPGLTKKPLFRLGSFYIIWKIHKEILASRPIQPACGTPLLGISDWVHKQLWPIVARHPFVLQNSAHWRLSVQALGTLKSWQWAPEIITADVDALYPSISHELGMQALKWFLDTHCASITPPMRALIYDLTFIVITDNFLEHPDLGIFKQLCGTAMGTALSVVYAIIFMIWFETPIVERFKSFLLLYKRYIDDLGMIFVGPPEVRTALLEAFNARAKGISISQIQIGKSGNLLDCTTSLSPRGFDPASGLTAWSSSFTL